VASACNLVLGFMSMCFASSLISVLCFPNFGYPQKITAPALGVFQPILTFLSFLSLIALGPNKSSTVPLVARARSLDSPATIQVDPTTAHKGKQKARRARDRAGTIRASDYQQTNAPPIVKNTITNDGTSVPHAHARRTRSGTVVGPRAPDTVISPTLAIARNPDTHPQPQGLVTQVEGIEIDIDIESDDELLLKAPGWIDEDLEYLGPPIHKFHSHALDPQADGESDDDLLLTGKWRDAYEDWPKEA
jgi:hypothetical protein